jgi:hypothetical protein
MMMTTFGREAAFAAVMGAIKDAASARGIRSLRCRRTIATARVRVVHVVFMLSSVSAR